MLYFEWDDMKAARNLRVHSISFTTASLVFDDPFRITEEDSVVQGEQRLRTTGLAGGIAIVVVIHLEEIAGDDLFVRIISARKATREERRSYDEGH